MDFNLKLAREKNDWLGRLPKVSSGLQPESEVGISPERKLITIPLPARQAAARGLLQVCRIVQDGRALGVSHPETGLFIFILCK
jgi:hypothetical protein